MSPRTPSNFFNKRVGTQTIGPRYHFTDEGPLVETALGILAMGSDILKFNLRPESYGFPVDGHCTLRTMVENYSDFRRVMDMPFKTVMMWAQPCISGGFASLCSRGESKSAGHIYQEIFDLAEWLLRSYDGTGKTFLLGNWEGDWLLLEGYDYAKIPAADMLEGMKRYFEICQQAVEDARARTPHHNVRVGHYIEVNRPLDAKDHGRTRLANAVLPHVTVDLISYSCYDALRPDRLTEALDYIESMAVFTDYFTDHYERRVFIGEYDAYEDYHVNGYAEPEQQVKNTLAVLRTALGWGVPFVLFWEFYNNESERLVHGGGFWLIDDRNEKQAVYHLHRKLLEAIGCWLQTRASAWRSPPSNKDWMEFIEKWNFDWTFNEQIV